METTQHCEVKEILEPTYVLYLDGTEWSRHPSVASAWAAAATIALNREWLVKAQALMQISNQAANQKRSLNREWLVRAQALMQISNQAANQKRYDAS